MYSLFQKNWIFRNNSKTIEKTKKKLEELVSVKNSDMKLFVSNADI